MSCISLFSYCISWINFCQSNKINGMDEKELLLELGLKIKLERVRKRLSQEKLAEIAGINQRSVSLIESGLSDVKFLTLTKIAEALDIKFDLIK